MMQSIPYAIEQACLHVERVASVIEPDRASYLAVHMIANVIDYVAPGDLDPALVTKMVGLIEKRKAGHAETFASWDRPTG